MVSSVITPPPPGGVHDHGLSASIVYGPLRSRRYGMNRGVNLLPPLEKRCDWNCVYCQLGYTSYRHRPEDFPTVDDVAAAVRSIPASPRLDALVVCGNGEPTLHPEFVRVVDALVAARAPGVRLVCLTNGQELWRHDIVRALKRLDETAVKLDAGTCDLLARVNVPLRPACVTHQIRGLKRLHGAVVQSCFLEGGVSNTSAADVDAWLDAVARAMPERVDVYTLDRPTPSGKLRPAADDTLRGIGLRVRGELGLAVRVFGPTRALALP